MEEIARACLRPPHRVMVKSGHNTGKTFLAAWMVNWFFDSFNPSIAITTAPTKRDVEDLLWAEIRLQRERAQLTTHFIGPSAPEMRERVDHYAKGYTANKGESFQGRHRPKMMFVMDEAVGVDRMYWTTTKTMWKPELGHIWLAILNPTTTTTQAYLEDQSGGWEVFSLSCLEHPNIIAEVKKDKPPVPAAVSITQIDGWLKDWATPITVEEKVVTDVQWPPDTGPWFRPGPEFEARCLGRWPSQGTYGVWSDALWKACTIAKDGSPLILPVPINDVPQIGCDVARFGDDNTAIHVRWGNTSLHHEWANGWKITQTVGQLIELARQFAGQVNEMRRAHGKGPMVQPGEIPIKVDDLGGGVTDRLCEQGFNAQWVNSSTNAISRERYKNKRSELWFSSAGRAREGRMSLGLLSKDVLNRLKKQLMAPEWEVNSAGQRVVEPKEVTKEKIGHSPDDADALNLAYYDGGLWEAPVVMPPVQPRGGVGTPGWIEQQGAREEDKDRQRQLRDEPRRKRRLFGR